MNSSQNNADAEQSVARQEKILAQAKQIMDNFFVALNSAKIKPQEIGVNRTQQSRSPSSNSQKDEEFRDLMFANAPNKDIDYIIAEKKHW